MDMRLEQREIRPEQPCGRCTAQFNVDGDVTLPGSLRETAHILHVSAMAVAESAEAMQDRVSVAGRVVFRVLYTQGERKQPTICAICRARCPARRCLPASRPSMRRRPYRAAG